MLRIYNHLYLLYLLIHILIEIKNKEIEISNTKIIQLD